MNVDNSPITGMDVSPTSVTAPAGSVPLTAKRRRVTKACLVCAKSRRKVSDVYPSYIHHVLPLLPTAAVKHLPPSFSASLQANLLFVPFVVGARLSTISAMVFSRNVVLVNRKARTARGPKFLPGGDRLKVWV